MSTVERGDFGKAASDASKLRVQKKEKTLGQKVEALLAWCRFVPGELGKL